MKYIITELKEHDLTFKLIRKIIKKDFAWVMDVIPHAGNEDEFKYVTFIHLVIDPYKFEEETGFKLQPWTKKDIENNRRAESPFLGILFDGTSKEILAIEGEVQDEIDSIAKSAAIPKEMKLNKSVKISTYIIPENIPQSR